MKTIKTNKFIDQLDKPKQTSIQFLKGVNFYMQNRLRMPVEKHVGSSEQAQETDDKKSLEQKVTEHAFIELNNNLA
jgi:hypothetical protein